MTLRSTVMTRAPRSIWPDGQRGQLAPPQPAVSRGAGHQLMQVPQDREDLPELGHVRMPGDLCGVHEQRGLSGHAHGRRRRGTVLPGLPVHVLQPRGRQVAPGDPGRDQRRDAPPQPLAFPVGGRGVDRPLHVGGLDVLAGQAADHRGHEPGAQPALGIGVLAGPRLPPPVRRQVPGDQVGTGPLHVRRVGLEPLDDLLQLGGQLLLGHRLTEPPPAVLCPDRPPRLPIPLRRVHRHPALQLHHHTACCLAGHAGSSHDVSLRLRAARTFPVMRRGGVARCEALGFVARWVAPTDCCERLRRRAAA